MKFIKRFFMVLVVFFMLATNTSCFAKAFEEEINVVFMYEDEYISHDTVTQFKNIKCPELSEAYIAYLQLQLYDLHYFHLGI